MNTKPIEMKGIVRNATKVGVADGCSEDLMNLRFKDGSWRTSGDGKHVFSMTQSCGREYSQLYVHVGPKYKHILGVYNGSLYWFANIANDGITFTALSTPVYICDVAGSLQIAQQGHLITIIDVDNEDAQDFKYFIYKASEDIYKNVNVSVNGKPGDRTLYPFGQIHFNIYSDAQNKNHVYTKVYDDMDLSSRRYWQDLHGVGDTNDNNLESDHFWDNGTSKANAKEMQNKMVACYGEATKKNLFTRPFLAVGAYKLYDGTYLYASNPVLLFPRQIPTSMKATAQCHVSQGVDNTWILKDHSVVNTTGDGTGTLINGYLSGVDKYGIQGANYITEFGCVFEKPVGGNTTSAVKAVYYNDFPVFCNGASAEHTHLSLNEKGTKYSIAIIGSQLVCSLENRKFIEDNSDVIQSFCIFVTKQADLWDMNVDADTGSIARSIQVFNNTKATMNISYIPKVYNDEKIIYQLMNSPFFLLKEYDRNTISKLDNPIVDLSSSEDDGVLNTITSQDTLSVDSTSRTTYLPKVEYLYNGRLHIANYIANQYHGFPIDAFHLHNHSVKYDAENYFPNNTDGRVLPNLTDDNDGYIQWGVNEHWFMNSNITEQQYLRGRAEGCKRIEAKHDVFAYAKVDIETNDGIQSVTRYIDPYDVSIRQDGRADFVENLNPLLTFPDVRAKKITIFFMSINGVDNTTQGHVYSYKAEFDMKPMPYLNMAYSISSNLKPIEPSYNDLYPLVSTATHLNLIGRYLDGAEGVDYSVSDGVVARHPSKAPQETLINEYYPNGLKVSATGNPMFFNASSTYRVGDTEIVALMSNAIAVGTGQTGAAPLYVFTKGGVYGMFVDQSGEVAYKNSRILARDVCNSLKSVVPIDNGVTFSTDRGLMLMSGEQVQEISSSVEGDCFDYDSTTDNALKVMRNLFTMQQLGHFDSKYIADADFLEFLKGDSIICYNHNNRELIVSNNTKETIGQVTDFKYKYSYVMDRNGNWSRRNVYGEEYLDNYPTSYRVVYGSLFKIDEEQSALDECTNRMFALSQPIKLETLDFKQGVICVARGDFETPTNYHEKTWITESGGSGSEDYIGFENLSGTQSYTTQHVSIKDYLITDFGGDTIESEADGEISIEALLSKNTSADYITFSIPINDQADNLFVSGSNAKLSVRFYDSNGNELIQSRIVYESSIDFSKRYITIPIKGITKTTNILGHGEYSVKVFLDADLYIDFLNNKTYDVNENLRQAEFKVSTSETTEQNTRTISLSNQVIYSKNIVIESGIANSELQLKNLADQYIYVSAKDTQRLPAFSDATHVTLQIINEAGNVVSSFTTSSHDFVDTTTTGASEATGYFKIDQFDTNPVSLGEGKYTYQIVVGAIKCTVTDAQTEGILELYIKGYGDDTDLSVQALYKTHGEPFYHSQLGYVLADGVITYQPVEFEHMEWVNSATQYNGILALYVFGSYDGRKWALLGRQEKAGHFNDIGCKVEHTDVKFFRVALAGVLTGKSRLDYFEFLAKASNLSKKVR